ncbi:MAG: putative CRISPR-associated protein [bacterium]
MRTVIATVGTSLLTNSDRGIDDDKRRPWAGWKQGDKLPELGIMVKYLQNADMRRASAKTNTFFTLPLQDSDQISLLHTQTDDGKLCAKALAEYYNEQGYSTRIREITYLNYREKSFAEKGLKSLVNILFEEIKEANNDRTPIFCATGGFKAEIAFLNLIGILLGINVYYIYEKFEELIQFPAFPITWNTDIVKDNLSFFEWIDEEPRKSKEVENRLHQHPNLRSLIIDDQDGNSYLSAAGDLLYKAYKQIGSFPRAVWPSSSERAPHEKIQLSGEEHTRPKNWKEIIRKLSEIDCVENIRYDGSAPSTVKNSGVYKIDASKGEIFAAYKNDDKVLPMVIVTTARGEQQCQLVANYIARKVKGN